MKKFVIGCAIVVAALVVLIVVVALVAAVLGYTIFSTAKRGGLEHERDVLRRHAYDPARAASLPPGGMQIIFSGTHPTKITDDGRTVTDSETGIFFVDMDSPRLTLLEEPGDVTPASGAVIRRLATPKGDVDVHADGTVHPAAVASTIPVLSWRSPDGAWYAYVDAKRFAPSQALIFVRADGTGERVVVRDLPAKTGYTLFWAPDSKKVFLYEYDTGVNNQDRETPPPGNTLYLTGPDAKGLKKFYATPPAKNDYLGPMLYVPARDAIVFTRENRIEAIDATTGATSTIWTAPGDSAIGIAQLSPDGTKLAVDQDFGLRVVDIATGKLLATIEPKDGRRVGSFEFTPASDRIVFTAVGNDDIVSHVSYSEMTSWSVTNAYIYVAKTDGSDLRQVGDESVGLTLDGVVSR